ncbi:hypothetical protein SPBR_04996 [Sporothrix brasiliensis 5110]|uniref:Glycosyl transferase CAP10 domain-containing protein n=1 Tax=Sporothrix brasiliensis 5110 TaxID=1398154 RepID=A0A0C2F9M7_9PEZI|nr:uncharacterized protein SPBR_04996 [Sporothrix brasiliensis 5110]KIH87793.1 hypothetical protein SPBR_04996 [Sporothrix brasiliensis 5110]
MPAILRWVPDLALTPTVRWRIRSLTKFIMGLTVFYGFMILLQPRFLPPQLWVGDTAWRFVPVHPHPITKLIEDAQSEWQRILDSGVKSTPEAAREYRRRRGRDPPPGFDAWASSALRSNSVIVERFFDRIYKDLAPFGALQPSEMRFMTYSQPNVIRIRDGRVDFYADYTGNTGWLRTWASFVEEFAVHLPDMDIPVNVMTTPRLAVDRQTINETSFFKDSMPGGRRALDDVIVTYSGLKDSPSVHPGKIKLNYTHDWETSGLSGDPKAYWLQYRRTCPLGSAARDLGLSLEPSIREVFPGKLNPNYTTSGYITNVTAARDPCHQPYIRAMYGLFVECEHVSTSSSLMPIFSGSKLPGNNDILLPSTVYLDKKKTPLVFDEANTPAWSAKMDRLYWRGQATGGVARAHSWWRFQRHRFVQMTDGVRAREFYNDGKMNAPSFNLPDVDDYKCMYPEAFQHHDI